MKVSNVVFKIHKVKSKRKNLNGIKMASFFYAGKAEIILGFYSV